MLSPSTIHAHGTIAGLQKPSAWSRFQRLLFPGLAAAAPPAYKNRAVRFVISNQNLFCQASLGLEMGASAPPDCITRHGGFLTSQPGVIGRLPEIGRGSSCFYRPESHRRDTGCQLSATCQAQQTYFFTQSAGNIFSICDRLFRRCFAGSSYEPMTYLLLWKPRLLLFGRLGGGVSSRAVDPGACTPEK